MGKNDNGKTNRKKPQQNKYVPTKKQSQRNVNKGKKEQQKKYTPTKKKPQNKTANKNQPIVKNKKITETQPLDFSEFSKTVPLTETIPEIHNINNTEINNNTNNIDQVQSDITPNSENTQAEHTSDANTIIPENIQNTQTVQNTNTLGSNDNVEIKTNDTAVVIVQKTQETTNTKKTIQEQPQPAQTQLQPQTTTINISSDQPQEKSNKNTNNKESEDEEKKKEEDNEKIPHIDISINYIVDDAGFDEAEEFNSTICAVETCANVQNSSLKDLWFDKQDYTKAGIGQDGILAIEGKVVCNAICHINPNQLAMFTRDYMRDLFGDGNVLSCTGGITKYVFDKEKGTINKGKEGPEKTICHFFVYPLNIRQLNPAKWVDSRSKQFKRQIVNDYISRTADKFGINLSNNLQKIGNGHTQYLDEFPMVHDMKSDIEELYYDTITEDNQIQTDTPRDRIEEISAKTIKYFTTGVEKSAFIKLNTHDISLKEYLAEADQYLKRMYQEMSKRDRDFILNRLKSAAGGFYVLDYLINDPKISDIKIVSPNKIRVKVEGQRRTSNLSFIDDEDYRRFLDGILTRYGRDADKAIHVFTDRWTNENYILRNNITLDSINAGYPTYHIRKIPKTKYTIEDLIRLEVMDEKVANYMKWAARDAKGMVFTGKGSSGKTTMMNTLLEYTPSDQSGLVIQESDELFSNKPELTFEHITDEHDLKSLARNGLLTDIDYFIIGEVKGDEAMYFINACDTGNKGWCSVHSPSSEDAIDKLADYVMYASKYDKIQALYMLKELQVIVFMKNFHVAEISEVTGWDESRKTLKYRTVFRRDDLMKERAH